MLASALETGSGTVFVTAATATVVDHTADATSDAHEMGLIIPKAEIRIREVVSRMEVAVVTGSRVMRGF